MKMLGGRAKWPDAARGFRVSNKMNMILNRQGAKVAKKSNFQI